MTPLSQKINEASQKFFLMRIGLQGQGFLFSKDIRQPGEGKCILEIQGALNHPQTSKKFRRISGTRN